MMARISCSRTSKETLCSARTPPKAREMPSRSRTTPPIVLPPFKPAPIMHPPPILYLDANTAAVGVRRQSRPVASPLRGAADEAKQGPHLQDGDATRIRTHGAAGRPRPPAGSDPRLAPGPLFRPSAAPAPCSCRLLRRRGRIGLGFLDAQFGADLAAAPVLELDLRLDELRRLARIERIDQHAVFLRDETAAHLARARQLVVIRIEFLVQDEETMHLRIAQRGIERKLGVGFFHALAHQRVYLFLLREVGVSGIGNIAPLGPVPDRADVDVDESAHHPAPVTESDRLPDVGEKLELVLDVVRCIYGAIRQLADVLGAVDDLQLPVLVLSLIHI